MTRLPVIVVPTMGRTSVTLKNVGKGPALNVVLAAAQQTFAQVDARTVELEELIGSDMPRLLHISPLSPEETRRETWDRSEALVVSYTDALGVSYATLASGNGTKVFRGDVLPGISMADLPPVGVEGPHPR